MVDRREMILARIKEVLAAIEHPAAANVFRARGGVPRDKRPAICLLSGRERPVLTHEAAEAPSLMALSPQIIVQLRVPTVDEAEQTDIELSALRILVMDAIESDEDLRELTGPNGRIEHKGHETDMELGSPMEGQMALFWDFIYVRDPNHYATT